MSDPSRHALARAVAISALALLLLSGAGCQPTLTITLEADLSEVEPEQRVHTMAKAMDIVERRLDAYGLTGQTLELQGTNRISVHLRGVSDVDAVKQLIARPGRLEFKHRTLNVPRDLEGIAPEDIVSVRITTAEKLKGLTDGKPATSNAATRTEAAPGASASPGEIEAAAEIPMLVVTFTPEAADRFQQVVDGLEKSLEPLLGSGEIYPSFLTIGVQDDPLTAVKVPFTPFARASDGRFVLAGGPPYISRVAESATYKIVLATPTGEIATVEDAAERFGEVPQILLGEIAGKIDEDVGLTGDDVARAYPGQHLHSKVPIVNIEFNSEGRKKFGEVTSRIAGTPDQLAIFLDEKDLIAPTVRTPITGGAVFIQGRDFTAERVRNLAIQIETGALPVPLTVVEVE